MTTVQRIANSNTLAMANAIRANQPWQGSNLRGTSIPTLYTGRMSSILADVFRQEVQHGHITYVIYSYDTPICWRWDSGQWEGTYGYSMTTKKQTGQVKRALRALGLEIEHDAPIRLIGKAM